MEVQIRSVEELIDVYKRARTDISDYLANLKAKTRNQKILAYVLKAIAVFGGIAIGIGFSEIVAQAIGIAIAVAVGVDVLFTNQKSLVVYATAALAIENYLEHLDGQLHNLEVNVIDLIDAGKVDEAKKLQREFYKEAVITITSLEDDVRKAISEANIQALVNLAVKTEEN